MPVRGHNAPLLLVSPVTCCRTLSTGSAVDPDRGQFVVIESCFGPGHQEAHGLQRYAQQSLRQLSTTANQGEACPPEPPLLPLLFPAQRLACPSVVGGDGFHDVMSQCGTFLTVGSAT